MIHRDREALSHARPQQPFSDAYLSGMPAKRRKVGAWGRRGEGGERGGEKKEKGGGGGC